MADQPQHAHAAAAVAAIVPAAGRSGRMGTPKQLLDVAGRPMLLAIVQALLEGGVSGVSGVTVVLSTELRGRFPPFPPHVSLAINDDPRTEMIESIRIGLRASVPAAGYLICPADAAGITAADLRRCVEAFRETQDRILVATHGGRRGHPMIFPASLATVVHSPECDAGLNQLARHRPELVREVACDSPGTIANVNTPADYERLKRPPV